MLKFFLPATFYTALIAIVLTLSACTPNYNWREVRGTVAPFVVLMPAKPSVDSRPVNLDGIPVTMTMAVAEVDEVTFAVGSAELPDAGKAVAALNAMKTALVKNIGGTIKSEKSSTAAQSSGQANSRIAVIDIEAIGTAGSRGAGQPRLLVARFVAKDKHIYQAVVVGSEKAVTREATDTFFTSFKLN
jgi:hypothetical protein